MGSDQRIEDVLLELLELLELDLRLKGGVYLVGDLFLLLLVVDVPLRVLVNLLPVVRALQRLHEVLAQSAELLVHVLAVPLDVGDRGLDVLGQPA